MYRYLKLDPTLTFDKTNKRRNMKTCDMIKYNEKK